MCVSVVVFCSNLKLLWRHLNMLNKKNAIVLFICETFLRVILFKYIVLVFQMGFLQIPWKLLKMQVIQVSSPHVGRWTVGEFACRAGRLLRRPQCTSTCRLALSADCQALRLFSPVPLLLFPWLFWSTSQISYYFDMIINS